MTDTAGALAGSAGSRRAPALALLCAVRFMIVLDVSVVNPAPSIARDLRLSEAGPRWVVSVYALAFGGFLLLADRAADLLFGRRRFFMVGPALFALGTRGDAGLNFRGGTGVAKGTGTWRGLSRGTN